MDFYEEENKRIAEAIAQMPKSELFIKSQYWDAEFRAITHDGWVLWEDKGFGDHEQECTIEWDQVSYLKNLMKEKKIKKQELSWILGASRPTVYQMLKGKSQLTHKQYLITQNILDDV